MRVVSVGPRETPGFLACCAAHRFDHDESFLDEHSLPLFAAGMDEKTVILLDEEDAVRGAASLMLAPAHRKMGRGRFRIFHAESRAGDCIVRAKRATVPF
jgi:mycothiol synthase